MGYYTRYSLELKPDPPSTDGHSPFLPFQAPSVSEAILSDLRSDPYIASAIGPDGATQESRKWYEHISDMRAASERYPTVLFVLRGEGEDSGDLWVKYFRGGKMQEARAQITYEAFDETKLV